ncbi:MAG: hypothetical protein EAX86_13545 [Candidatus Heimdallarchaeota archaeon]|nr:hypothetical protein [Candidatus Heimdallarchaeota archaeon]
MNKQSLIFILFLIILIFGVPLVITSIAQNSSYKSQWRINNWNEARPVSWNWPDINFTATIDSYLNYTLEEFNPNNFTHPSSGKVEIGNLTTIATNNKTAESLLLSIYGWFPGLVTSSGDWELQKEVAMEAASGFWTEGDLYISEHLYSYSNSVRKAINFTYSQNSALGNQNTSLVYDKETGVLLEGFSEIFFDYYYVIDLQLVYSDLIKVNESKNFLTDIAFYSIILPFLCMSIFQNSQKRN